MKMSIVMQLPQIQASPSWMASSVASVYTLPPVGKDECAHFQPDKAHTSKFLQPWDLDRSATHVRPDLPRRHRRADVPASWAADLFSVENSNAGAGDSCFPTICQSWRVFLCKCGAVLSELSAVLALERWLEAGPRTGDRAQPRWLSSHHGRHGSLRQRWLWQDKCSRYSRTRWKTNVCGLVSDAGCSLWTLRRPDVSLSVSTGLELVPRESHYRT